MPDFNRADFNADLLSKMDELRSLSDQLLDSDPDSKAFCFLAADLLETLDEDKFKYTDGPKDLGIDFYIRNDNDFRIYQCKSAELSKHPNGKIFDSTPVNELNEAIDYLLFGNRMASTAIQNLKNAYQINKEEHSLTAALVIQGKLSSSASERFQELKHHYKPLGIELRLYDENSLFERMHSFDNLTKPRDVELKLAIENNCIMKMAEWFCAVVSIESLLAGMEQYRNGLFDLNVRSNLKRSSVNAAIRATIATQKGQRQFVHLNNGLVITCNNFIYSSDNKHVTLKGAQVINGCQTLNTLWDYYCNIGPDEQRTFCDSVKVFVKVINSNSNVSLDDIIVASNNQNPMNERNLKSNSHEQRAIQASFYNPPLKSSLRYFYIRKDGEFESYLENTPKHPKKHEFAIPGSTRKGVNRYRHVDNETIAKIWWAWIGNSPSVNAGNVKVFSPTIYPLIFRKRPAELFWEHMSSPNFSYDPDLMEEKTPTPYQYLLALAVSSYLEARIKPITSTALKRARLEELVKNKQISSSASPQEQSAALSKDADFLRASWMRQMTFPLTEISAFILCSKYQSLNSEVCKRLLDFEDISYWLTNGMDSKLINSEQMSSGLLQIMFELLELSVGAFITENQNAILLDNRPKMYLGRRDVVSEIKQRCSNMNESMKIYPSHSGLKAPGFTYLDSMPSL